jgi:dynein heavy chain 2
MAMSQGQVTVALDYLNAAARQGDWLCLKNLHLMTYWLPALEKELKSLQPNENFRLWFTAEAHPKFSAILAQSCLKVTYEVLCYIHALMLYHEKFANEICNNN